MGHNHESTERGGSREGSERSRSVGTTGKRDLSPRSGDPVRRHMFGKGGQGTRACIGPLWVPLKLSADQLVTSTLVGKSCARCRHASSAPKGRKALLCVDDRNRRVKGSSV